MIRNLLIFSILLLVSCSKTDMPVDRFVELDENDIVAETYQYVSYAAQGNGSGNSPANAADFLNNTFWEKVAQMLDETSVRVVFAAGDYSRAYTERALILNDMGHPENRLTLEGVADRTIFSVAEEGTQKSTLFDIRNSQNIHVKNFSFTGSGLLGYGMRILSDEGKTTTNVLIENCSWTDMLGIVYGAAGAHNPGTSHVTYLNCTFKRIGIDSHSHHIYNAYGPSHVYIIDSHFEDCTGDHVRFRDNMDYGVVRGCTFVNNQSDHFQPRPFISIPVFNSREPVGDEYFPTNYSFTDNAFINTDPTTTMLKAIMFYHGGFSPPEWNYLLTAAEGSVLEAGSVADRKALLLNNFGVDTDKIRISGNAYSSRINMRVSWETYVIYGATSLGFSGLGNVSDLFNNSTEPFLWEMGSFDF